MPSVPKYDTAGVHIIADFHGIPSCPGLNDVGILESIAKHAIELSNATLLKMFSNKFEPQGITLSAIISESSMDIHTYPEHGYMSVSFYTCGDKADPIKGIKFIRDVFKPDHVNVMSIGRGTKEEVSFKVIHIL